jgi:hypothetical protein
VWPDGAVHADHVRAHGLQLGTERLGVGAVVCLAIGSDGHLSDDRKITEAPHCLEGRPELGHVAECFQDETAHPPIEQSPHLPRERRTSLIERHLAERLDADTERTDSPDHCGALAGRFASQPCGYGVDPLGLVGQSAAGKLDGIGAEGIRFDHLGAGAYILPVNFPNHIRLPKVQLVVADVEEHALSVEHGAHGSINHVHTAIGDETRESLHPSTSRSSGWGRATALR